MTDWTAALDDINTRELAAEYRRAVAEAIPDGTVVPAAFWTTLADAVTDYFIWQEYEAERPSKDLREKMQGIGKLIRLLGEELRSLKQVPLSLDNTSKLLSAMGPARSEIELHVARYSRMIAAFRGHNPHRLQLYSAVLQLWCHELGQGLGYAKKGPLVRFFVACVGPILGDDTPSASGIAKVVEREKLRYLGRAYTTSKSKK